MEGEKYLSSETLIKHRLPILFVLMTNSTHMQAASWCFICPKVLNLLRNNMEVCSYWSLWHLDLGCAVLCFSFVSSVLIMSLVAPIRIFAAVEFLLI